MNEVLAVFLEQVAGAGLNATALRALKKEFKNGMDPIIKEALGDPVSRKRARLELKLAEIQAQIEEADNPTEEADNPTEGE